MCHIQSLNLRIELVEMLVTNRRVQIEESEWIKEIAAHSLVHTVHWKLVAIRSLLFQLPQSWIETIDFYVESIIKFDQLM